jgi:hypothetical protein
MHSRGGPAVQTTPVVEAHTGILLKQSELPAQVTPPQCSRAELIEPRFSSASGGCSLLHCARQSVNAAALARRTTNVAGRVPKRCFFMFRSLAKRERESSSTGLRVASRAVSKRRRGSLSSYLLLRQMPWIRHGSDAAATPCSWGKRCKLPSRSSSRSPWCRSVRRGPRHWQCTSVCRAPGTGSCCYQC